MSSNFAPTGEPVLSNNALEALKSFIPDVFMGQLVFGTFKVLLYYLQHEQDREGFLEDYLNDVERLLEFLEVLRNEYESSAAIDKDDNERLQEAIEQNKQKIAELIEEKSQLADEYNELVERYSELVLPAKKRIE